jgi:hypothetical protein
LTRAAAARKKAAKTLALELNGIQGNATIHVIDTGFRPNMHEALSTLIRVPAGTTCSQYRTMLDKRNLVEYCGWAINRGVALGLIELRK